MYVIIFKFLEDRRYLQNFATKGSNKFKTFSAPGTRHQWFRKQLEQI